MPRQEQADRNRMLYRVAELFMQGKTTSDIAELVSDEMKLNPVLSRERIYPMVRSASSSGFLRLIPPIEESLNNAVAERYGLEKSRITVVDTPSPQHSHAVAGAAADLALRLLKRLRWLKGPIGLGLGPGRATLDFSESLGGLLASDPSAPKLELYAISAGCPATSPRYAPSSFFNMFPRDRVEQQIGMFSEPLVKADEFERIKDRPGFKEVLAAKRAGNIRVVATSMGDFEDTHDLLRRFLVDANTDVEALGKAGWIGNVQYRPYGVKGPIKETDDQFRAVTLYELDELSEMAQRKDHHVILMARQCAKCGMTRARALRPLLEGLRPFSELVTDAATARDLLN